jgi:hypothetical protein
MKTRDRNTIAAILFVAIIVALVGAWGWRQFRAIDLMMCERMHGDRLAGVANSIIQHHPFFGVARERHADRVFQQLEDGMFILSDEYSCLFDRPIQYYEGTNYFVLAYPGKDSVLGSVDDVALKFHFRKKPDELERNRKLIGEFTGWHKGDRRGQWGTRELREQPSYGWTNWSTVVRGLLGS